MDKVKYKVWTGTGKLEGSSDSKFTLKSIFSELEKEERAIIIGELMELHLKICEKELRSKL